MINMKKLISVLLAVILACTCVTFSALAETKTKSLVLLGDSIAWGSGIYNSEDACYGKIVANTNGYDYYNHAVPGHTTTNLLNLLLNNENIINNVKKADIISISIGGNDFLTQNLPMLILKTSAGDYEMLDSISDKLAVNFADIIETIKEYNSGAVIIVQNLYNPRTDSLHDIYDMAVDRVNSVISGYLEQNAGAFEIIDVRSAFEGHSEYVASDKIHPSAAGNVEIAKILLNKLYELGLGANTEPVVLTPGVDQTSLFTQIISFFKQMLQNIKDFLSSMF